MTQRDPEFGAELDAKEVARLTGLNPDDLDPALPPQTVSTGTAFAIVPVRSAEALARLRVDHHETTPWLRERGARWFYVLGPTGERPGCLEPSWRARMQFHGGERRGHWLSGRLRDQLSGAARRSGFRPANSLAQGVGDRPDERHLSQPGARRRRFTDVRVAGSTVSRGKRASFPVIMHILSTGIHQCKLRYMLDVANFHLFHSHFQREIRLIFPTGHHLLSA